MNDRIFEIDCGVKVHLIEEDKNNPIEGYNWVVPCRVKILEGYQNGKKLWLSKAVLHRWREPTNPLFKPEK